MKRRILINLILFSSILSLNAQVWTPGSTWASTNGQVGIGITIPESKLHIADGEGGDQLRLSRGTGVVRFIQSLNADDLFLLNSDASKTYMYWKDNGNIGIGTTTPSCKLDVCGTIRANEVKVDLAGGCDFVFKSTYKLMDLNNLENFVKTNKHLPEVASEKEMIENGVNMKELQMKLLQKIEELTLYTIEQNKKIEVLESEMKKMKTASK